MEQITDFGFGVVSVKKNLTNEEILIQQNEILKKALELACNFILDERTGNIDIMDRINRMTEYIVKYGKIEKYFIEQAKENIK